MKIMKRLKSIGLNPVFKDAEDELVDAEIELDAKRHIQIHDPLIYGGRGMKYALVEQEGEKFLFHPEMNEDGIIKMLSRKA